MSSLKEFIRTYVSLLSEVVQQKKAAIVFIQNEKGLVLSVSRKDDASKIGLPGGKVDFPETASQAAKRELFEETGLVATNLQKIFSRVDKQGYETTTFVGSITGTIHSDEEGKIQWVTRKMLLNPQISPFADYNQELFKIV